MTTNIQSGVGSHCEGVPGLIFPRRVIACPEPVQAEVYNRYPNRRVGWNAACRRCALIAKNSRTNTVVVWQSGRVTRSRDRETR